MEIGKIIGENLRKIRNAQNLSFGQLSEKSGVSKAQLSQMERGESNPSIETIWKIAGALHVPYTALLEERSDMDSIVRGAELVPQHLPDGALYCYYKSNETRSFELFSIELDVGGSYLSPGHGEHTQEYVLVERGTLQMVVGDTTHVLQTTDAVRFDPSGPHTYLNIGDDELRIISINYYR